MADLDEVLRESLRRVEAPAGFADRVVARAERKGERSERSGWWRAVAAAFLLGAMSGGWLVHREHVDRERAEARETREQFEVAMRITGRSLGQAQRKIEQLEVKGETR